MNLTSLFRRKPSTVQVPATTAAVYDSPKLEYAVAQGSANATVQERVFTEEQFSSIVGIATRMELDAEKSLELEQRLAVNERVSKEMEQLDTTGIVRESEAYRILGEVGLEKYARAAIDTVKITRSRVDDVSALVGAERSIAAKELDATEKQLRVSRPEMAIIEAFMGDVRRSLMTSHPELVAFVHGEGSYGNYQYHFGYVSREARFSWGSDCTVGELLQGKIRLERLLDDRPKKDTLLLKLAAESVAEGFVHVAYVVHNGDSDRADSIQFASQQDGETYQTTYLSFAKKMPLYVSFDKHVYRKTGEETPHKVSQEAKIVFSDPNLFVSAAPTIKSLEEQYRKEHPGLLPEKILYVKDFCEEKI